MTDIVIRTMELIAGCLLITVTLLMAGTVTSPALQALLILLPLFALPLIFSGLFNWHPAKRLGDLLERLKKPLLDALPLKVKSLSH